jgi:hypothetical protein
MCYYDGSVPLAETVSLDNSCVLLGVVVYR